MSRDIGDLTLRVTALVGAESLAIDTPASLKVDGDLGRTVRGTLDRGEVELLREACDDFLEGRAI